MAEPNWKNRTLWTGDNLHVMRGMNSESVDLIYLDPPFNSNQDYAAPIGSEAAGASFKDTWALSDVDKAWHGEIAEQQPALYSIIAAAGQAHGASMKSYLIMMAVRLLEMRRILKPTGSIYLHCDPTASHYLKMLLGSVIGRAGYKNEVVWRRTGAHGRAKRWGPIHDTILFYALFGMQEGKCNGCGYAFPFANFEVDRVEPRAHGGTDHMENLQLLCNACNRRKGTKSQAQFLAELKADGPTSNARR